MRPDRSIKRTALEFILTLYIASGMFALIGLRTTVVNFEYEVQQLSKQKYDLLRKRTLIINDLRRYFTIVGLRHMLAKIPGIDINNVLDDSNIKVASADAKKASLQKSILLNIPSEMVVGQKKRIEVPMSMSSINALRTQSKDNSTYKENSNDGTFLKVRILGDNFKINSLTEEKQVVVPNETTYWLWDVYPITSGPQELTLTASEQIIPNNNGEINRNIFVLDKKINSIFSLSYSLKKFIHDDTAIILAKGFIGYEIVGGFINWLKRRRKKKNNEQTESY